MSMWLLIRPPDRKCVLGKDMGMVEVTWTGRQRKQVGAQDTVARTWMRSPATHPGKELPPSPVPLLLPLLLSSLHCMASV